MSFVSGFQTTFGGNKKESEIIGAIIGGRLPTTEIGDCFSFKNSDFDQEIPQS